MLVDTTPPVGPAARFGQLPLAARVSAGVLLLGAALFAIQRLRRGSGCAYCHRPSKTYSLLDVLTLCICRYASTSQRSSVAGRRPSLKSGVTWTTAATTRIHSLAVRSAGDVCMDQALLR